MGKSGKNHKQSHRGKSLDKEQVRQNWETRMDNSKDKKMSRGAQNIARVEKTRTHWSGKAQFGTKDKQKNKK